VSLARRCRLGPWLTLVIRPRAPREADAVARRAAVAHRLRLTGICLLAGLAIAVPAYERAVYVHDRRVVARDFACVEAGRAAAAAAAPAPSAAPAAGAVRSSERIEIGVEGFGVVSFPPGLSDRETIAALQAMLSAHHDAGHASHEPPATAGKGGPVAASARAEPEDVLAPEAACRVARLERTGGSGRAERYSRSAWRSEYAGEPPSIAAEGAAGDAVLRSVLALLAGPLFLALRGWWRWLIGAGSV
jgi:hypothetical protein